jgi:hypothetical protein
VIQPIIWSKSLSANEHNRLIEKSPSLRESMWRVIAPSIAKADPEAVNFTHILDEMREQGNDVFFDEVHVNEYANEVIAKTLYEIIAPIF